MKNIFFGMLLLASGAFSTQAHAVGGFEDMGILAGYRLNDGDAGVAGQSADGVGGFQIGGLAFLPLNDMFSIRTGFIYAQRNYEVKSGTTTTDVELSYFDIPVTFMYKLGDLGGIFAGPGLGLKVSDDCGGSDCSGVKSTLVPITIGAHFKVMPQFSLEAFYEMTGDVADAIESARAVGVNALVTFE